MKKAVFYSLTVIVSLTMAAGCKVHQPAGTQKKISKDLPVPINPVNNDSTGTSPSAKLTPTPVPNQRPNPIPNPLPPNPPM